MAVEWAEFGNDGSSIHCVVSRWVRTAVIFMGRAQGRTIRRSGSPWARRLMLPAMARQR